MTEREVEQIECQQKGFDQSAGQVRRDVNMPRAVGQGMIAKLDVDVRRLAWVVGESS